MARVKGTWRFHDVPTPPASTCSADVEFVCLVIFKNFPDWTGDDYQDDELRRGEARLRCNSIKANKFYIYYNVFDAKPDFTAGGEMVMFNSDTDEWHVVYENAQTITFTHEQEVSDEFYEWFSSNADEVTPAKTIEGEWQMNQILTLPVDHISGSWTRYKADFICENSPSVAESLDSKIGSVFSFYPDGSNLRVTLWPGDINGTLYNFNKQEWRYETGRIWFMGKQIVSDEFYEWFTANAVKISNQVGEISYDGAVIASLFKGREARLSCKGKEMLSDITVKVPQELDITLQEKTVTENGDVMADEGYDGLRKVTVNVPQTVIAKECNHEVYDLSSDTIHDIYLKPRIARPTAEQIDKFVNNNIAFIAEDAEPLEGILALEYQVLPITDDITLPVVFFRSELKNFFAYYVWQEDIEIAKMALSAMGSDVSGVTGEGWQLATETGFRTITDEELEGCDFYREDCYLVPYGDYFYSLFNFYSSNRYEKTPADVIVADRNRNILFTKDKLCQKDIYLRHQSFEEISVIDQDGSFTDYSDKECDDLMYIDFEIIGDCPDWWLGVTGHAYNTAGNRRESFYYTLGNVYRTRRATIQRGSTFGISILAGGDAEIGAIYTNATVVSQSETEVYISGLRHNTHITVVAKDAGGGGSGDVGGLTKHARVYATPEIGGLFTITNPLGGLARKVTITCPEGSPTLTASGMIQKCTMDADVGLGSLYYIHATNGAISCTGTRQEATANANARFAISEGLIEAKSYASSNGTWDTTCEYVIDIWQ